MSSVITYTSFAVVGANGILGKSIVDALSSRPFSSLTILSRSEKLNFDYPRNVKVVAVEYENKTSIVAALKANNVQVIIDTTNVGGKEFHVRLADASKEAGISLFVPSEWGIVAVAGAVAWKAEVRSHLQAIELPYALVYTSLWTEYIPWIGHTEDGKFHILGKGDTPITVTSLKDAAEFLAHILTTQPPSALENTSYRLQGDRATLNQIAKKLKLPVEYHTDSLPNSGQAPEWSTILGGLLEEGKGSTGWDAERGIDVEEWAGSGNRIWEGHNWKTIEDIHCK